ncbi:MAG: SusC/RagA family protein [Bacteroides sp. 41_26]|nr:MAG: SusC/RagA family protein [Bacteroides sp. 41_26]
MENFQKFLFTAIFLFVGLNIQAQSLTVTGKVIDSDGFEVIGANVVIKGATGTGTITDIDGKYSLKVNNAAKDVLVFTYIGMDTQEIPVNGRSQINVTLVPNSIQLDEVVAIGYATTKRRDLTGSVSSVQGGELSKIPVSSVTQALAGKIAGVQVIQSQGSPDAEISVRVRGGMSITQSNEPLYIIDGFQSENGMNGLDPSDIESIDVLKDASSTAIYGSAGANGVILITTKSGKEGKATVSYDMYVGFKKLTKRIDLLSTEQFAKLEYERAMIGADSDKQTYLKYYADPYDENGGTILDQMYAAYQNIPSVYGNRAGIDWQDEVFGSNSPISQNHKVSISGGTKTSSYNISIARTSDDGIMKGSGFARTNIRAKFTQDVNKRLKVTFNANYSNETSEGLGSLNESGYFSRMQHILQYRPVIGKYGNDSDLLTLQRDPITDEDSGNQMQNPLISIQAEERTKENKSLQINGEVQFKILDNLIYRGSVGLRERRLNNDVFYQAQSRQAINSGAPYGTKNINDYNGWQYNNTVTYTPKLKNGHSFDVLVGQEDYMLETKTLSVTNTNFPDVNFGFDDFSLGTNPNVPSTTHYKYRKISFFGRANYNYKSKYLATVTVRIDGSNRFGKNNKWGVFPAGSVAWRASEEDFIKNLNVFSNLKVRFGYGMAGNDNIGSYRSLAIMGSGNTSYEDQLVPTYASSQLPNPNLKWETNITANLGLEMGFLDQRIQATIDIYNNQTKDLLLNSKLPGLSGYTTVMKNVGETRNRGIEVSINTINIRNKNFTWESNLNFAHNKNKIVALADADYFTERSGWSTVSEFNDDDYIIAVGQSMGQMYGYQLDGKGIYMVEDFHWDNTANSGNGGYVLNGEGNSYDASIQPGYWKFKDTDGVKGITSDDKTVIGNATPDIIGGFINNFTFKGFDLSIGLNFQIGGDVYNANKMYFTKMNNKNRNSLANAAERFTYIDGTGANVFKDPEKLAILNRNANYASIEGSSNLAFHSGYVEDASFLRLNNVTFGYTFPKTWLKKAYISNLRVYASAYNLFTITGYSGYDPEVNTKPNGGLTPGVDWGAYPRSLSFVFGLNLSF